MCVWYMYVNVCVCPHVHVLACEGQRSMSGAFLIYSPPGAFYDIYLVYVCTHAHTGTREHVPGHMGEGGHPLSESQNQNPVGRPWPYLSLTSPRPGPLPYV